MNDMIKKITYACLDAIEGENIGVMTDKGITESDTKTIFVIETEQGFFRITASAGSSKEKQADNNKLIIADLTQLCAEAIYTEIERISDDKYDTGRTRFVIQTHKKNGTIDIEIENHKKNGISFSKKDRDSKKYNVTITEIPFSDTEGL